MQPARTAALAFAATHVAACAAGAVAPGAFGRPWLGDGAHEPAARAAVRGFALVDGLVAAMVADAAVREAPLRALLRFGAASDVSRAAMALSAARVAPRTGTAAVVSASLAGATLATLLSRRVN